MDLNILDSVEHQIQSNIFIMFQKHITGGAGEQVQAGAGPAVGASRAQPDGATTAVILVLRVLLLLAA